MLGPWKHKSMNKEYKTQLDVSFGTAVIWRRFCSVDLLRLWCVVITVTPETEKERIIVRIVCRFLQMCVCFKMRLTVFVQVLDLTYRRYREIHHPTSPVLLLPNPDTDQCLAQTYTEREREVLYCVMCFYMFYFVWLWHRCPKRVCTVYDCVNVKSFISPLTHFVPP